MHLKRNQEASGGNASFWTRMLDFVVARGFYLVLLLCAGVIGVTAWIFSTALRSTQPLEEDYGLRVTAAPREEGVHQELSSAADFLLPEEDFLLPQPPQTASPGDVSGEAEEDAPVADAQAALGGGDDSAEAWSEEGKPAAETMASVFYWPLSGRVERPFSSEALSYDRTMADWRTHEGLDIAAGLGTRVCAAADGSVEQVYTDERYGVTVVLYHGGGLRSISANLAAAPTVQAGDEVRVGDVIGAVGDTALMEQGDVSHLHFSMTLDGQPVDPADYLPQK